MRLTQLTIKSWTQCCHHTDTFWSDWIVHSIQGFNAINPYLLQTISLKEFKLVDLLWFASCLPVFLLSILISICRFCQISQSRSQLLKSLICISSSISSSIFVEYSKLNRSLLSILSVKTSALESFKLRAAQKLATNIFFLSVHRQRFFTSNI